MSPEKLAYMAHQIATAFATRPREAAITATAEHINTFWDPRMREQLLRLPPGGELDPIVAGALPLIRPPQTTQGDSGKS